MLESEILNLKFYSKDLKSEVTVREFFKALLVKVWEDKAVFDGKRPWGFSHWDSDLIGCLEKHDVVPKTLDENGQVSGGNIQAQSEIIKSLILAI